MPIPGRTVWILCCQYDYGQCYGYTTAQRDVNHPNTVRIVQNNPGYVENETPGNLSAIPYSLLFPNPLEFVHIQSMDNEVAP